MKDLRRQRRLTVDTDEVHKLTLEIAKRKVEEKKLWERVDFIQSVHRKKTPWAKKKKIYPITSITSD